ncbi:hypothetical protein OE88DRAFT_1659661 [Heliocybe sulcata]|uniref:Uncharacterized protein n=1 Tax=Heliocybe sulcata TaxID=5364 RepID=A0A5C3N1P9_9AGAM|nr:hypothetical protein OE88DRAFT_1659661 [Heliocybe sulcata]
MLLSVLTAEILANQDIYSDYKIAKVERYKNPSFVGHEFLLTHIILRNKPILLRMERRPSATGPNAIGGVSHTVRDPVDCVTRVMDFNPKEFLKVSHLLIPPGNTLLLADVCRVCQANSKTQKYYRLFSAQCYWFCEIFMRRMVDDYKFVQVKGVAHDRGGRFGAWLRVRVMSPNAAIEDIQQYDKHLKEDQERSANSQLAAWQTKFSGAVRRSREQEQSDLAEMAKRIERCQELEEGNRSVIKNLFEKATRDVGNGA